MFLPPVKKQNIGLRIKETVGHQATEDYVLQHRLSKTSKGLVLNNMQAITTGNDRES